MTQVELISPANNWDTLKSAVNSGADAVYPGIGRFNARMRADNFNESDFGKVTDYCHERGVKVYVALNTLVKNSEINDYFQAIEFVYSKGADAVIIQDLVFLKIIKENFPGLKIHVSTQAGVFNSYYKSIIHDADCVVLPREFTINQIKEFVIKTKIPVEVFVQGALCFSIGGQCLMSSFLGGRSGNRGFCAQPCRKKFNKKFILSTKDLCTVDKLTNIVNAGVSKLKIEGRLRSPEYVGAATELYRHKLDNDCVDEDALTDLKLAFSREYTRGALFKEYDITTPEFSGKRGIPVGKCGKCGIVKLKTGVRVGDGVGIHTKKGIHGDIIREILYNGKSVKQGFLGQTVNLFLNAHEGDNLVLTSGVMRRKPKTAAPKKKIIVNRHSESVNLTLPKIEYKKFNEVKLLVKTYSLKEAYGALKSGASYVYYDLFKEDYPGGEVNPYIPGCLFDWNAKNAINKILEINPASILCGDLGVAVELKKMKKLNNIEIYLDISCNAFNDLDVNYYNNSGLIPIISPELSLNEIKKFKNKRFCVYAHGRIPLMTTKYCLDADELMDERNYVFPIARESDYKQILNSVPIGLYDKIQELMKKGIKYFLLDPEENAKDYVLTYKRILNGERIIKPEGYTIGNYKKGVV